MLGSILSTVSNSNTSVGLEEFLICSLASLILGALTAAVHTYKNRYSGNFILTILLLPLMVQSVIMLVNGNLGTGVAVMGAFSLVRFRSMPGNSREISSVFLAMAMGLAVGMGYLGMAILLLLLVAAGTVLCTALVQGKGGRQGRDLRITIPENLDYSSIFDDLFQKYTRAWELIRVKTTNMGSLYELQYRIDLTEEKLEKEMIDELRCRNGNLTIVCGREQTSREEL